MKINFTKKEYRLLVDLLEISEWVLNSHDTEDDPEKKKYSELIQKIYADSKAMDCEDILEYAPEQNQYYATLDYEENSAFRKYVDKFENNVFWDSLALDLSRRDFVQQEGYENIKNMGDEERMTKLFELKDWYDNEFADNGLDNVKVVKEKDNSHH